MPTFLTSLLFNDPLKVFSFFRRRGLMNKYNTQNIRKIKTVLYGFVIELEGYAFNNILAKFSHRSYKTSEMKSL